MTFISRILAGSVTTDPEGSSVQRIPSSASEHEGACGISIVSKTGQGFAFKGASLHVDAAGGMARITLEQVFENPHATVLDVTYRMPLPENAVVSAYAFELEGRVIRGEVDTKKKARERFVAAVASGHSAALLESSRANIFTQEIGNIPPQSTLVVRITLEQKLTFLPEGAWEFRFPTVIGPRYISPTSTDTQATARDVHVTVSEAPLASRMELQLRVGDVLPEGVTLECPTHVIATMKREEGLLATFAEGTGVRLDRDIVIRWKITRPSVGLSLVTGRPPSGRPHASSAYGLLTVTPPEPSAMPEIPRDLIVLMDTSGSMEGLPLEKAKQAVLCILQSLGPNDRFELCEFSSAPSWYTQGPRSATSENKRSAMAWVKALSAGGATEMFTAVKDALALLRPGSQRQVLIATDGYFGGEQELVKYMLGSLPSSCRLHTIGVGGAGNGALLQPLARAGRGMEVRVDADGDVERQIAPLMKRLVAPILTDVVLSGDALLECAPAQLPDVFLHSPLLAAVKLRPEGGTLTIKGQTATGPWTHTLEVSATNFDSGEPMAVSLFAREFVEDLETRWVIGADQERFDREIESVGVVFQIVTRMTSFVAIDSAKVHARTQGEHDVVPQEIPYGTTLANYTDGSAAIGGAMPGMARTQASYVRAAPRMRAVAPPVPAAPAPRASMGAPPPSFAQDANEDAFDAGEDTQVDAYTVSATTASIPSTEKAAQRNEPELDTGAPSPNQAPATIPKRKLAPTNQRARGLWISFLVFALLVVIAYFLFRTF